MEKLVLMETLQVMQLDFSDVGGTKVSEDKDLMH